MADNLEPHFTLLDELDARQDSVISALDELNERLESLLRDFTQGPPTEILDEREAA